MFHSTDLLVDELRLASMQVCTTYARMLQSNNDVSLETFRHIKKTDRVQRTVKIFESIRTAQQPTEQIWSKHPVQFFLSSDPLGPQSH